MSQLPIWHDLSFLKMGCLEILYLEKKKKGNVILKKLFFENLRFRLKKKGPKN
jgi:hypothetical protein